MDKKKQSKILNEQLNEYLKINKIKKLRTKPKQLSKKLKKKIKNQRSIKKHQSFKYFANEIEKNLPKSESWFRSLYEKHFKIDSDLYNRPFCLKYIPDVLNERYRYIIEIDGSIHETEMQSYKDRVKDKFYKHRGYKVFRILYGNEIQYINLINSLMEIREDKPTNEFKEWVLTKYPEHDIVNKL